MKGAERRREVVASKRKDMAASSSDDEDSDVEKNFALLAQRGGRGVEGGAPHDGGEEEFSDEEVEDGTDGSNEEEEDDGGAEDEVEGDGEASEEEDDDDDDDDDEEREDAGGSSEIQTRDDIKKELSSMSFEDVLKLQNKVGTKVYNEVAYGSDSKTTRTQQKRRLNKNRPMEVSAKRPPPFLRQVVAIRKPTLRDPRFDDLSGEYKPEIFEKTYQFISDIRRSEKQAVQKQLRKTKSNTKKEKLQFLLKRMENQERARTSREQQRERELQFKRQQRERANQGARPFFFKASEKKKLQLAEKYQELKKSGKLENFLSKKRKRNAGKDRRKLPTQPHSKQAA